MLLRVRAFTAASILCLLVLALPGCAAPEPAVAPTEAAPTAAATLSPTLPPTRPKTEPPMTTLPPTEAPVTEPPETLPTETQYAGLTFLSWSESVAPGGYGTATIQGHPNTEYAITVYYKSGPSKAKGLTPQTSGEDGIVTWQWKIGSSTSAGSFKITVTGGGETQTVSFTVTG